MADAFMTTMRSIQSGLNVSTLRSNVILNNIANVDTPGFRRSSVPFSDVLTAQMMPGDGFVGRKTRTGHRDILSGGDASSGVVVTDEDTMMRIDENNVDIENEMTELAKNQLYYDALIAKLNGQFSRLRTAIVDTR